MSERTSAVVVGSDADGLGDALAERGVAVTHASGTGARSSLADAGAESADLLVVTDAGLATSIPVARELNPDVRVVAYTRNSLPEFVSGQEVLAVDPELLDAGTVAEELVDG